MAVGSATASSAARRGRRAGGAVGAAAVAWLGEGVEQIGLGVGKEARVMEQ